MQATNFLTITLLSLLSIVVNAQKISGEQLKKVVSENFVDRSDLFPSQKNDANWTQYVTGDEYYYMERKVASPYPILAKHKGTARNFVIKTKVQLGPVKSKEQTISLLFLVQKGGKGGYILEINKKKQYRLKEIKSKQVFSPGTEGWTKSKNLKGPQEYNKIEVKSFRGLFDVYFNGIFEFSFEDKRYNRGQFGFFLGPNISAKVDYFYVYNLEVPGAGPEISIKTQQNKIDSLQLVVKSLNDQLLEAKYGKKDKSALDAIKILEGQIQMVRAENEQLKKTVSELEEVETTFEESPETIQQQENYTAKINALTENRDSLNSELKTKNEELNKLKLELIKAEEKSSKAAPKQNIPASPVVPGAIATPEVQNSPEDIAEEENNKEESLLTPLKDQEIKVKKAKIDKN